ncbi:MAG TPA: sigma-70 family RNA polymerase sigma factor [Polyangia bacterium]|jgi:RNA polymerase sigma-70 factor (ECF subfamily)|nr:sigma-70 family RNA polymerase sigma factor [Polyangia bacterium]
MFGRADASTRGGLIREALAYADALHDFAYHLTANATEAEDLVQETYARALGAADQFAAGSNLKAWLFRILHHLFIDNYRRERSRRTEGGLDTTDGDAAERQGDPAPHEMEQGQLKQVVGHEIEEALMRLTPDARLVVLLDLQGFTEAEMASLLECAPGTVKSRLYRARATLRELLREHHE